MEFEVSNQNQRAYRGLPCPRVSPRLISLFDEVDCARVSAKTGCGQMNEVGYGSFLIDHGSDTPVINKFVTLGVL